MVYTLRVQKLRYSLVLSTKLGTVGLGQHVYYLLTVILRFPLFRRFYLFFIPSRFSTCSSGALTGHKFSCQRAVVAFLYYCKLVHGTVHGV